MSIEELLKAALLPAVRDAVREELRRATGATKPGGQSDYVTVAEAAAIAGVHPETIRKWIRLKYLKRSGAGRHRVRAGGARRVRRRRRLLP